MVIDTSALLAILLGEKETKSMAKAIAEDPVRLISSFSLLESSIVIEAKKGEAGERELDLLVHKIGAEIINFDLEQSIIAKKAWREYGKGRHPAALNIGDCCTYALSKISNQSVLFKGNDFNRTDIKTVAYHQKNDKL